MDDLGGEPTIFGNTHMFQVKLFGYLFGNICQKPNAFDSVKNPEASHGGALLHVKAQDLKFLEAGGHGSDHHEGSMGTICVYNFQNT